MTVLFETDRGLRICVPESLKEAESMAPGANWAFMEGESAFSFEFSCNALVIVTLPGFGHFLLRPSAFDADIRDFRNDRVNIHFVMEHWEVFEPIILFMIREKGQFLKFVPYELRTYEMCLAAVRNSSYAFHSVALVHKTAELCMEAVSQNGELLEFVPRAVADYKMCLAAVRSEGYALQFVPKELIDVRLLEVAVETCGEAIWFAPSGMVDAGLFLKAVSSSPELLLESESFIEDEFLNETECKRLVHKCGMVVEYLPEEFLTPEVCKLAVRNDPAAISEVPVGLLDDETIMKAIVQAPSLLSFVPNERKTPELCAVAVMIDPLSIRYVPHSIEEILQGVSTGLKKMGRPKGMVAQQAARAIEVARLKNSIDGFFS